MVVNVISESRTTSSRTLTASPGAPTASRSAATSVRRRVHHESSAASDRRVMMTFSTARTYRRRWNVHPQWTSDRAGLVGLSGDGWCANVRMVGLPQRSALPDLGAVGRSLLGVVLAAAAGLHWGSAGAATAAA